MGALQIYILFILRITTHNVWCAWWVAGGEWGFFVPAPAFIPLFFFGEVSPTSRTISDVVFTPYIGSIEKMGTLVHSK